MTSNFQKSLYSPPNPDDEGEFGFWWHVEVVVLTSLTMQPDAIALLYSIFLDVLLSPLEGFLALYLPVL